MPYSWPATTQSGMPSRAYSAAASWIAMRRPVGWWTVTPPSTPGTMRFLIRTFANVPRTITWWFPRREP